MINTENVSPISVLLMMKLPCMQGWLQRLQYILHASKLSDDTAFQCRMLDIVWLPGVSLIKCATGYSLWIFRHGIIVISCCSLDALISSYLEINMHN